MEYQLVRADVTLLEIISLVVLQPRSGTRLGVRLTDVARERPLFLLLLLLHCMKSVSNALLSSESLRAQTHSVRC